MTDRPNLCRLRSIHRRTLLLAAAALASGPARAADPPPAGPQPFDGQTVKSAARSLAASPYKAPDTDLPDGLKTLTYDQYRNIRFDPAQALWHGQNLPFEAQFFHRGFLYPARIDIFEVAAGRATPIPYRPEMFNLGGLPPPPGRDLGFAGFRLHAPINRPDYFDEVAVFLGASYFRAVGKNLTYGISARGLALSTGAPGGEEFPLFRAFWLERPQPGNNSIVVSALLDSPSTSGAVRITIRPGDDTTMDVELTLFPRVDLPLPGIAAGTSMFLYDTSNRVMFDDWRPAVHDSDALMITTGHDESLVRQLANPRTLQLSSFVDSGPRGFGLMQRQRTLSDYEDLEAQYERRPSLWTEPIGDWGPGAVTLVEIPSRQEIHDNMVAFWRPKDPLRAHTEHSFTYRLHWCADIPAHPELARFTSTRTAASDKGRVYVLQASGGRLKGLSPDTPLTARVLTDRGTLQGILVTPDPAENAWRLSFELQPGDERIAELHATLLLNDQPITETWTYRWTA